MQKEVAGINRNTHIMFPDGLGEEGITYKCFSGQEGEETDD